VPPSKPMNRIDLRSHITQELEEDFALPKVFL